MASDHRPILTGGMILQAFRSGNTVRRYYFQEFECPDHFVLLWESAKLNCKAEILYPKQSTDPFRVFFYNRPLEKPMRKLNWCFI